MKILIASHGDFSKGCLDSVRMIMGDDFVKDIQTYSLKRGENPNDYVNELKLRIDTEEEYVVFTDIYGGSVFNAFTGCLDLSNIRVISGTNINMLIEFMLSTEKDIDLRIQNAIQNAREGIQFLKTLSVEKDSEEF